MSDSTKPKRSMSMYASSADYWKAVAADNAAEIDRLRAALRTLLDMDVAYQRGPKVEEAVEAARAALGEG